MVWYNIRSLGKTTYNTFFHAKLIFCIMIPSSALFYLTNVSNKPTALLYVRTVQ